MQHVPVDDVAAHGPETDWRDASTAGSDRFAAERVETSSEPNLAAPGRPLDSRTDGAR